MVTEQEVSSGSRWNLRVSSWRTDIRILLIAAMIVFLITVAIGLLNGQRIVQLSQDVLLTHVHAGTIGWITLSVFAISIWLFGEGVDSQGHKLFIRWSSIIAAISVPLYVLAFLSGNYIARAVFGVPVLLVMIAFFAWVVVRSGKVQRGVAQLAILASLLTLVLGGLLGVLLQFQFATSRAFLPNGAFGAHPATMVAGYLVLIGMALSERSLLPDSGKVSRLGIIQITLFFLAGLAIGIGILFNITPLYGVNTLFQVVGVIIYIVRFAPRMARLNWLGRNSERFFAMSAVFVVINIALTVYLTVSLIIGVFTADNIPSGLLIALDHAMFVGVMTNAIFGLIRGATEERRAIWPWAEDVLFWGMNIGVLGFIITLLSGVLVLERVFTPIMGLSILLGLLVYAMRMRAPSVPASAKARASVS
jgi:hypothetical protein